jgi:hypothetical protein
MAERPLWPGDRYGQETVMAERALWPGDRYGLLA